MQVRLGPRATKELLDLPRADRDRIEARIAAYAADPASRFHDVKPIVGTVGGFRLRVGIWRVLFELDGDRMNVKRVAHRREAYR